MPPSGGGGGVRKDLRPRHVNFLFHRVLAMYKLSVIFLQLGLRYRTGATQEPRYAPLTGIGTGILEFTHEIAQGRAF